MPGRNKKFLASPQELLRLTQVIQLYTESVQGGIPQRIGKLQGILFLLLICQGSSWHHLPAYTFIDCQIICFHCVGEA